MAVMSFAHTAIAQNYRGAVRGRVTDQRGASIPGAQLKLIEQETNEARIVKTDGNGDFTISLLRPGSYRLEVESAASANTPTRLRCRSIRISGWTSS